MTPRSSRSSLLLVLERQKPGIVGVDGDDIEHDAVGPLRSVVTKIWSALTSPRSFSRSGRTANALRPCHTITWPRVATQPQAVGGSLRQALDLREVRAPRAMRWRGRDRRAPTAGGRASRRRRAPSCTWWDARSRSRPRWSRTRNRSRGTHWGGCHRSCSLASDRSACTRRHAASRARRSPGVCSTACSPGSCGPRQPRPRPPPPTTRCLTRRRLDAVPVLFPSGFGGMAGLWLVQWSTVFRAGLGARCTARSSARRLASRRPPARLTREDPRTMAGDTYDYIIVGAGTAGACWPTGSQPTRTRASSCWRPAARTTTTGSTSPSATST